MDYEALAKRLYDGLAFPGLTHPWEGTDREVKERYIAMARMAYDRGYAHGHTDRSHGMTDKEVSHAKGKLCWCGAKHT